MKSWRKKIFLKSKKASKIGYKTCATCPEQNFSKKLKILIFFKKGAPEAKKNENFEKIFSKLKRASKIGYKTCATLPEREIYFEAFCDIRTELSFLYIDRDY